MFNEFFYQNKFVKEKHKFVIKIDTHKIYSIIIKKTYQKLIKINIKKTNLIYIK